jgi:hypothetical protein
LNKMNQAFFMYLLRPNFAVHGACR